MNQRIYTIGQLASEVGIRATTIRFYERSGLLRPTVRSGSGRYRVFGDEDLSHLRFIRSAQAAGFSLDDIKQLLCLREGHKHPCNEVAHLIDARLDNVKQQIKDLRRSERFLQASFKVCGMSRRKDRCKVIDSLSQVSRHDKR